MNVRRRDLLVFGGIVALIYGLRALPWDRLPGHGPRYADIADLPPFRRLEGSGQTSGETPAFVGLDPPSEDADQRCARADVVRVDPCPALFGTDGTPGVVPIAYFSEFRCPYCRALERDIDTLLAESPASFRLVQHELPIFGLGALVPLTAVPSDVFVALMGGAMTRTLNESRRARVAMSWIGGSILIGIAASLVWQALAAGGA